MSKETARQSKEAGYVIVTVAIVLIVLLGFSALAVDSGVLYSSRTSAQRIADGAALAGAHTFISDATASQPATAEAHARAFAEGKTILGDAVQSSEVTVNVDTANRRVTVDIVRTEETYMAKSIGFMSTDVGVTATAEAGSNFTGSNCVKPWFVPNSIFIDPSLTTDPSKTACSACPGNPGYFDELNDQLLIREVGGTLQKTQYAQDMIDAMTPFRIKPNNPSQALKPSQFYAITMGNGRGASTYGENILRCSGFDPTTPAPVKCADCYQSEPGNMVGPTTANTELLINDPNNDVLVQTDPAMIIRDSAGTRIDPGQSRSRVTVPIWDICSDGSPLTDCGQGGTGFCPGEKLRANGRNVFFKVVGFADIFVSNVDRKNGVDGYLLDVHACPAGLGGITPGTVDSSNVLGFPLRLVRPPSP